MENATFVLFGATGDLAKRKIYPALYNLFLEKKLPPSFHVIGLGRRELSDEAFQASVEQSLTRFSRRAANDSQVVSSFISAFRYNVLDIGRKEDYTKLLQRIEQREKELSLTPNRMFYLSVGPEFFAAIAENIKASGLGSADGWKRLLIEKPFGHDLQSARELNRQLSETFAEQEIFRIDHYLGKPMVQKLGALQQTNPVLDAIWSNRYIANVQITANETVGVEERAGYYDHTGAVRDMFQNHMLQLLMMLAIHLPKSGTAEDVRLLKKKVMESLVPLQKDNVAASVIRGQYAAGTIQGTPVPGYTSEPNIAPESVNDTFIAAKLQIDAPFWRGVPFYIRTGKRMKEKSTRIVVEFKEPLKQQAASSEEKPLPNLLVFEMSPHEGITLQLNTRDPQHQGELKPIHIDFQSSREDLPEAYENLLYDALLGNPTFFAHWDEVELSWQWVEPILQAFEQNLVPLQLYPAGTYGPAESDALLENDGYHWWFDTKTEQGKQEGKGEHYAYHTNH